MFSKIKIFKMNNQQDLFLVYLIPKILLNEICLLLGRKEGRKKKLRRVGKMKRRRKK